MRALWLAALLGNAVGCPMAGYLAQAARGQVALWKDARPIGQVLADSSTDERTRTLLAEVAGIKAFGAAHGLTPTKSYSQYVDVKRPAVCWVVSASPALELRARVWTFPVVGSFPYLGWFSEQDARNHAEDLRGDGWDVDVRPVGAYSTLGFLDDAVLSTMVAGGRDSVADLANVILHESVHATLHLPGQATFNESLASFIADGLTPLWLQSRYGEGSDEVAAWLDGTRRGEERVARLHETSLALRRLYASPLDDAVKLQQKWRLIARVRDGLGIRRPINNATLVQYQTYETGRDAFSSVLAACGGDHGRLLRMLSSRLPPLLAHAQETELDSMLLQLARDGC